MQTFEDKTLDEIADDVDATLAAMGSEWRVGHWVDVTGLVSADVQLVKVQGTYRPSEIVTAQMQETGLVLLSSYVTEAPC